MFSLSIPPPFRPRSIPHTSTTRSGEEPRLQSPAAHARLQDRRETICSQEMHQTNKLFTSLRKPERLPNHAPLPLLRGHVIKKQKIVQVQDFCQNKLLHIMKKRNIRRLILFQIKQSKRKYDKKLRKYMFKLKSVRST